ncbi:MAG: PAS domain S-box protein [Clostridia bacterium]|nr:PAS domain S-box protein [Clostridia bacterium]
MRKKLVRYYWGKTRQEIKQTLDLTKKRLDEIELLLKGTAIVLENCSFKQMAKQIFDLCQELIGATAGYVALVSEECRENVALFLDTGESACTLEPKLPIPLRGLRKYACQSGKTVFENNFTESTYYKYLPQGHIAIENVLFSPLVTKGKVVGLLGLANKKNGFSDYDVNLIQSFSELMALALDNSRKMDILHDNEERFKAVSQRSENRFRTIFENAPVGIVLVDPNTIISLANSAFCKMVDYTKQELENKTMFDISHPEDLVITASFLKEAALGNKNYFYYKKRYISKTGKIVWANVAISVLKDINGNIENYLVMVEDITQKIEAEEQLAKARRKAAVDEKLAALGTLAAGIAHEINQPLNSLKVNVDSILYCYEKFGKIDEGELIAKLKSISQETEGISSIINNVRSFVRNERSLSVEPCDINNIIENVLQKMEKELKDNKIILVRNLKDIPCIKGNRTGLETVVVNLLNNSVKAFKRTVNKQKEIAVSTLVEERNIYIEISDNATGINESILDMIYDPFFTTGAVNEGMGLGLTMVHWVVKRHQGNIEITNNNQGGVTCRIQIPILPEENL